MSTQVGSAPARVRRAGATTHPRSIRRATAGKILYGVARGIADYARLDPTLVRIAFGLVALAGGLGVILYIGLALVLPERASETAPVVRRTGLRAGLSVALITGGFLMAARSAGFWFGDSFVGPIAIAALGASVLWIRTEPRGLPHGDATNPLQTLMQGRVSPIRVLFGAVLIFIGAGTFLAANSSLGAPLHVVRLLMLPVVATVAGLLLIFGPWLYRLASQLTDERRERIRSEERSALAAHLHDSVLQTLALIQRSDDPHRMTHLARTQERELRAWLFGKVAASSDETLTDMLEALAGRCESRYQVMVEVVTVGDVQLDARMNELIAACGEAINNAATHSGSSTVSVYAEAEHEVVTIYVRDEGTGFSVTDVAPDRRGITDSIEGLMRRVGGTAVVQSEPGSGTEVILTMPLGRS